MRLPLTPKAPASGRYDVVGLGLNTIDVLAVVKDYPTPDSKQGLVELVEHPGGQAATTVTACARLGWRARYVGRFGSDARGQQAHRSLAAEGIDLSMCETVDAPQAVSLILVDGDGRRTVLWQRAAALNLTADDVQHDVVAAGRVLHVDCHQTAAATQAAVYARRAGVPTVVDVETVRPGIDRLLAEIDILIAAGEFPEAYTGVSGIGAALAALASEFRPALVCVTLGPEGSLALVDGTEIRTPGFEVPVVDTTGAGDVFRGGFIAGWLGAGPDPDAETVLAYANAVAALKCRGLGARAMIPRPDEVTQLLRNA